MTPAERLAAAADRYIAIFDERTRAWRLGMPPQFTFDDRLEAQREFDAALAEYRAYFGTNPPGMTPAPRPAATSPTMSSKPPQTST